MAGNIRYSSDEGFPLAQHAPGAPRATSSAPTPIKMPAPGQNELTERVSGAFHAAFPPSKPVPTLRKLVTWLITTEFKDVFFKLSKKEQQNSIQGILRTLQGGQSSLTSTFSPGRGAQEGASSRPEDPKFHITYSMLPNGFNGLRYRSETPISKMNIKQEAKDIYALIHGKEPSDIEIVHEDAQTYTVEDSIISSLLRCAHGLSCARAMQLARGDGASRTICYAARPDTYAKLCELVTMLFWTEVKEGRIVLTARQKEGLDPVDLRFVINSLISTFSKKDIIAPGEMTEYELLLDELKLLVKCAGTDMEIENPDQPGQKILVRLNYKIYCGNFNFVNALERALPESISGETRGLLISDSVDDLAALIPQGKMTARIRKYLYQLRSPYLKSEEKLLLRFLVAKEAGLPNVIHCRSCVDRTTIAAAMIYALNQWTDLEKEIPENPLNLFNEEEFKELFWGHIAHAIEISSYSRKEGGYKWHTGPFKWFTQHPAVLRLMPKRLLQSFNWWDLSPAEKQELSALSLSDGKIKNRLPYFAILPFLKVVSTLRKIKANETDQIKPAEVALATLQTIITMTLLFVIGEVYGILLFAFNIFRLLGYSVYYAGTGIKNLQPTIGPAHIGFQEKGSGHSLILDLAHLFLGFHLAAAPFTILPSQVIKKGVYIQRADKEKVPVLFGDTPIEPEQS